MIQEYNQIPPFTQEGSGGLGILPWWKNTKNRRLLGSESGEWWYQMKEMRGKEEFWQEAKKLFKIPNENPNF